MLALRNCVAIGEQPWFFSPRELGAIGSDSTDQLDYLLRVQARPRAPRPGSTPTPPVSPEAETVPASWPAAQVSRELQTVLPDTVIEDSSESLVRDLEQRFP